MQRNDEIVPGSPRGRDHRHKLRCRHRTHFPKVSAAQPAQTSAKNIAHRGKRGAEVLTPPASLRPPASSAPKRSGGGAEGDGYSAPMRRISRNSAAVTGMTDRRESRTSCIFFNRGFFLISPSVTGRRNGLIGARSTVLQSPSFAVLSA